MSKFSCQSPFIEGEVVFSGGESLEPNQVCTKGLADIYHNIYTLGRENTQTIPGLMNTQTIAGSELLLVSGTRNINMDFGYTGCSSK